MQFSTLKTKQATFTKQRLIYCYGQSM